MSCGVERETVRPSFSNMHEAEASLAAYMGPPDMDLSVALEIRDPRSEIRDPRSEIRDPRSEIRDPRSQHRSSNCGGKAEVIFT